MNHANQIASLLTEDPDIVNEIRGADEFRKSGAPLEKDEQVMNPMTGTMMEKSTWVQWKDLQARLKKFPDMATHYNKVVRAMQAKKITIEKAMEYLVQKLTSH